MREKMHEYLEMRQKNTVVIAPNDEDGNQMQFRACLIDISVFNPDLEYNGCWGADQGDQRCEIVYLFDADDEIFAFVLKKSHSNTFVGNTDDGSPDSAYLRHLMLSTYQEKMNEILLASVDIEEIHDEGLHHFAYVPDYDVDDLTKPFFLRLDFPNSDDLKNFIFVRHVYGSFEIDETSIEKDELDNLMVGNIETAIVLAEKSFGEITEFATETEQLVLIHK